MCTSCSNTRSKSLSKWQDCLINELLRQIVPYRQQGSLQFGNVGQFWRAFLIASQHCTPHTIIQWIEIWRIRWPFLFSGVIFMSKLQFNDLFTLKNAHLSSNSYNSWTQPNIVIKFTGYVALIFLYKCCKFGETICNNSRGIEFFLGDYYFLARPVGDLLHTEVVTRPQAVTHPSINRAQCRLTTLIKANALTAA